MVAPPEPVVVKKVDYFEGIPKDKLKMATRVFDQWVQGYHARKKLRKTLSMQKAIAKFELTKDKTPLFIVL